jgi:hypothetical protein
MSAIHQIPMLHRDNAVGRHTLRLGDVLAERAIRSSTFVEMSDRETARETRHFTEYDDEAAAVHVLLHQLTTASAIAPWLAGRRERLAINYHNVTPPDLYPG